MEKIDMIKDITINVLGYGILIIIALWIGFQIIKLIIKAIKKIVVKIKQTNCFHLLNPYTNHGDLKIILFLIGLGLFYSALYLICNALIRIN